MRVLIAVFLTLALLGCPKSKPAELTTNEVQQFHSALQDGDAAIIDRLLAAKPALANAKNDNGETPLKVAKQKGSEDVAEVIKRHGGHE